MFTQEVVDSLLLHGFISCVIASFVKKTTMCGGKEEKGTVKDIHGHCTIFKIDLQGNIVLVEVL